MQVTLDCNRLRFAKKMHRDKDMIVKMYTGYLENGILGIDYEILAYLE